MFVCVRARYRRLIVFEMFNTLRRFYCGILRGPHVALNCVWLVFFLDQLRLPVEWAYIYFQVCFFQYTGGSNT